MVYSSQNIQTREAPVIVMYNLTSFDSIGVLWCEIVDAVLCVSLKGAAPR